MIRNVVLFFRALVDDWRECVDNAEVRRLQRLAEEDYREQSGHPSLLARIRAKTLATRAEAAVIRNKIGGLS